MHYTTWAYPTPMLRELLYYDLLCILQPITSSTRLIKTTREDYEPLAEGLHG